MISHFPFHKSRSYSTSSLLKNKEKVGFTFPNLQGKYCKMLNDLHSGSISIFLLLSAQKVISPQTCSVLADIPLTLTTLVFITLKFLNLCH